MEKEIKRRLRRALNLGNAEASTSQGYEPDFTHSIQATSSNRICQLVQRHLTKPGLNLLNSIFNENPLVKGVSEGLTYEHFKGTLGEYEHLVLVTTAMWSTFWCEIIPKLVEDFDSDNSEMLNFYISGMSYETYCKEFDKFDMEIELLMGSSIVERLKNEALLLLYPEK
nr:expressed protein [Hymenolepis microstoma]